MIEQLIVNWPLKLLSLAIAFGIWLSVTGEARVVQDFSIPLDVQLPDNRIATVDLPNTVTVRLRGPESAMRRLDPITLSLSVDLPEADAGSQDVQLLADHVGGVPRGVDVDFIDPLRLQLQIEARASKSVKVDPTFLGNPPEGFSFYGAQVLPDRVTIEGPESEIELIEQVRTNAIRLDQRSQRFVVSVGVVPEGEYIQVTEPGPIRVVVDVDTAPVEQAFLAVPVLTRQAVQGVTIDPALVDILISGPEALLEQLNRERIRPLIDVAGLQPQPGPYSLAISVEFNDIPVEDTGRLIVKSISRKEVAVLVSDGESRE